MLRLVFSRWRRFRHAGKALCLLAAAFSLRGDNDIPPNGESLHYTINWPSGLSLGEAHLEARQGAGRWTFKFTLDAGIPGFQVSDRYQSEATATLCSLKFEKRTVHGSRRAHEKTTFNYKKGLARRATVNGGKSEIPISSCAHDALDFLFFTRRELAQGRVPPAEVVLAGAPYNVRMEYTGAQTIAVNEVRVHADRVVLYVKGMTPEVTFEAFFARDAARTLMLIRVPFSIGTFSMELVR